MGQIPHTGVRAGTGPALCEINNWFKQWESNPHELALKGFCVLRSYVGSLPDCHF